MENKEALIILQHLTDGVDPITGASLPKSSPYYDTRVAHALCAAIKALERKIKFESREKGLPINTGKLWTSQEEEQITDAFDEGRTIDEIAEVQKRTPGSVRSRLIRLGRIKTTL